MKYTYRKPKIENLSFGDMLADPQRRIFHVELCAVRDNGSRKPTIIRLGNQADLDKSGLEKVEPAAELTVAEYSPAQYADPPQPAAKRGRRGKKTEGGE